MIEKFGFSRVFLGHQLMEIFTLENSGQGGYVEVVSFPATLNLRA